MRALCQISLPIVCALVCLAPCPGAEDQLSESEQVALAEVAATTWSLTSDGEWRQAPAGGAAGAALSEQAREELSNHHRSFTTPIASENVQQLAPSWTVETAGPVSHRPLVGADGGTIYFADWTGMVWAVAAKDGSVTWRQPVEQNVKKQWPWHGFAGTGAIAGDVLYEASVEGTAYAIDTKSGSVLWSTRIAQDPEAGNLSRLLVHDGLVYIGLSSVEEAMDKMKPDFEPDFHGSVVALDAESGEIAWRKQLVQEPHNGVAVWSSFALDPDSGTVFFTTSNNYTGTASELSDAIVAVDAKTGETVWADQVTQHDVWTMAEKKGPDYAFGAGPQLFEAEIDGQRRQLVGAGQKSGVFYVWDRSSGERLWNVTVGYGHIGGGIHGEASIGTDRIFIWGNNSFAYKDPAKHPMDIKAVDIATGDLLWVQPKAQPAAQIAAGFLANDVYFAPSLDGMVRAYAADDGRKLWTSQEHGPTASSLWVSGDRLFWGFGVPARFGGGEGQHGVVSYALPQTEQQAEQDVAQK